MKKLIVIPIAVLMSLTAAGFSACAHVEEKKSPEPNPTVNPAVTDEPACEHKTHDAETLLCDDCGEFVPHYYVNGVCTRCGATTKFMETFVTESQLVKECNLKGTIETVTYDTRAYSFEDYYDTENLYMQKTMNVYLPAGYDAEDTDTRYNVLILMHGGGETQDFWFGLNGNGARGTQTVALLDNMTAQGLAEKTIVVTPTFSCEYKGNPDYKAYVTIYHENNYYFTHNFYKELQNDILPYIAQHYNTYAESSGSEDLIAARDHFGFAGLSMGSATVYLAGWRYLLPYFSYFGNYSAGATINGILSVEEVDAIIEKLNGEFSQYDVKYWLNQCGTEDERQVAQIETMRLIMEGTDGRFSFGSDFENGDNCDFVYSIGAAHDYDCWLTGLYNSMSIFFKL